MGALASPRRKDAWAKSVLLLHLVGALLQPPSSQAHARTTSAFFSSSPAGIRAEPLWNIKSDGGVTLADNLNPEEAERARKIAVAMLARLYEQDHMPFRTKNYARAKGVLDRVPLEAFMDAVAQHLRDVEHQECLEWGPFWTHWPNVTQPYMKKFNCKRQWTFYHDAQQPRMRTMISRTVFGELDRSLTEQGLEAAKGKFDLLIIPQTLQYVVDPQKSVAVLFELLKPGGYLVISAPFMQTIMPYPTDYYRFTAEGNEKLLRTAGFQVLKSYLGGNDMLSICWLMACGVSDLPPAAFKNSLSEAHADYSGHKSYILSAQLAQRPEMAQRPKQ